jgi:hypothetical protein
MLGSKPGDKERGSRDMKRLLFALVLCVATAAIVLYATANGDYPPLQDGDLVFQTSTGAQSNAVLIASANPYTHMGLIKNAGGEIVVVEAVGPVKETPLKDWIGEGLLHRIAIYRDPELSRAQAGAVLAAAATLYGRPYDIFFSFNNESIYCNELAYLAYKAAGISIGKVQKVSELNFDNPLVKSLIEQRWQRHSECTSKGYDFEACYKHILDQELVTPASIARDSRLKKIYPNYPL